MSGKHFILATAGHVDHGKSSLIKALTGTDPDRLPEEKARGITIELGFANLSLGEISLGIVDVPGHEDFIRQMIAGVRAADAVLLVVAADDGWMPQTEEHLQIASYLGVRRMVVALTKCDLADSLEVVRRKIREELRATAFADAPIIPVSATKNIGLNELRAALASELSAAPVPRNLGKPRLAIDRVFTLRGVGTVVTGTVADGCFRRGESLRVQPSGRAAKIRALQNHNHEVQSVEPGQRAALSLPDLAVNDLRRGDVVTAANSGRATAVLEVSLERSPRLPAKIPPVKNGARVWIHHGSAHHQARVFFLEADGLSVGESQIAQLRFDEPIFAQSGDRLVARDSAQRETLAGGVVLAVDAVARGFRSETLRTFLRARANAPEDASIFVETQLQRDRVSDRSELMMVSHFSAEAIDAAIAELARAGKLVARGESLIAGALWEQTKRQTMDAIDAFHRENPNLPGAPLATLRANFPKKLGAQFANVVAELGNDFQTIGEVIARRSHRPTLSPQLQQAAEKIRAALAAKPFDPPSRSELARDSAGQQALRFLREQKEIVELSAEVIVLSSKLVAMRETVVALLKKDQSATAGELRQALQTSRRVIIPLLERLDRDGVTRRVGDRRVLAR